MEGPWKGGVQVLESSAKLLKWLGKGLASMRGDLTKRKEEAMSEKISEGAGGQEDSVALRAIGRYLKDKNPNSALLVSGAWGAGKTHLITSKKDFLQNHSEKKFVAFSVAGLSTREELDQALFLGSAPWLLDGHIQAASVFAKAALRFLKIEPKDFKFKAGLSENSIVVVIEDIDRFFGDLRIIFGLVVDLVDQSKVHTIMVAAEEMLLSQGAYSEWKEKIVGQTVLIEPDIPKMIDVFLKEIPSDSARSRLISFQSDLERIAIEWGLNNLRSLRFSIKQLALVVDEIGHGLDKISGLEKVLLCGMFLGLLEVRRSANAAATIGRIFSHEGLTEDAQAALAGASLGSDAVSEEATFVVQMIERYPSFEFSLFPGGAAFHKFFRTGDIAAEEMVLAFAPQAETVSKREVFLRDYLTMSQEEFDQEYESIISDLDNGRVKSMAQVARIYLSLKFLANKRSIELKPSEVKDAVLKSIGLVNPGDVADPDASEDFWYLTGEDAEVDEVREAIESKRVDARDVKLDALRARFWDDEEDLAVRLRDWRNQVLFIGRVAGTVSGILRLSPAGIQEVVRLLGSRSRFSDFQTRFAAEKKTLVEIADELESSLGAQEKLSMRDSQLLLLARAMRDFSSQLLDAPKAEP